MKRMLTLILSFFCIAQAQALSLEVGAGYGILDLSNPDNSKARSTGMGGMLGAYYSLLGDENYDLGLKGSAYFAQLDNDINTSVLQEQTKYYNLGGGLELNVYNVFAGWQYKYNRIDIQISGNLQNTTAFSDYMSQFEIGYAFYLNSMSIRLSYQRTDGKLPMATTALSADTDFTSNAFMVILRFDIWPTRADGSSYNPSSSSASSSGYGSRYKSESTYQSRDSARDRAPELESGYVPNYRSYRYSPRPSPNIR